MLKYDPSIQERRNHSFIEIHQTLVPLPSIFLADCVVYNVNKLSFEYLSKECESRYYLCKQLTVNASRISLDIDFFFILELI